MSMFKRCSTAVALVLASSVPVLAQDSDVETLTVPEGFVAPEGSIVLQFAGNDALFLAPYETAAELCQVSEGDFAAVAESGVDVIYCEQLDEESFATFNETEGVETLVDRESGSGDDGAEAAEGDSDAEPVEVDEGTDDGAEGGDSAEGEGAMEDGAGADESDDGSDADVEADAEVDAGADVSTGD